MKNLRNAHWFEIEYKLTKMPFWVWAPMEVVRIGIQILKYKVCSHHYVDYDPGNPEDGPQPNVSCTKCGHQLI